MIYMITVRSNGSIKMRMLEGQGYEPLNIQCNRDIRTKHYIGTIFQTSVEFMNAGTKYHRCSFIEVAPSEIQVVYYKGELIKKRVVVLSNFEPEKNLMDLM